MAEISDPPPTVFPIPISEEAHNIMAALYIEPSSYFTFPLEGGGLKYYGHKILKSPLIFIVIGNR